MNPDIQDNKPNREELIQTFAEHLNSLIIQKNLEAETQVPIAQKEEVAVSHNRNKYIAWSIGAAATGGGIYLETIGEEKLGTTILVFDFLFGFNPVYMRVLDFTDRLRAAHKDKQKETI